MHVRSAEREATPLILTHGWPNTFVEYLELIGPLTDPAAHGGDPADAFDVVIPSLPGFGFSGRTRTKGWNAARTADAWAELMDRRGGHWAAHDAPDLLVDDLRGFFRRFRAVEPAQAFSEPRSTSASSDGRS
ncbi:alpha/beta fold hydrolase [Actinoallomurus sp. CA-142502]|uniref:alpha/beta fold hydrolase n=1 Tax=Actinoallomurus sp. CA-142502 TaxID=3239885 RepID=UPI003D8A776A